MAPKSIFDVYFLLQLLKAIKSRICNFITSNKEKNKLTPIILNFFNAELPCPDAIPSCDQLRREYLASVRAVTTKNTCKRCLLQSIKQKYIESITLAWQQQNNK